MWIRQLAEQRSEGLVRRRIACWHLPVSLVLSLPLAYFHWLRFSGSA
jgi:hypothetical protein